MISREEQEQSQRKGFVTVLFSMVPRGEADRTVLWEIVYMFRSLPSRVASIHFCYDDPSSKSLASLIVQALDQNSRARFRIHYGKFLILIYRYSI
jgi:hypothetical protein